MSFIAMILVLMLLFSAVLVLILPNSIAAVAVASVFSLLLSLIFVFLQAPDVAMTEAVVGAGLSGVILAISLKKMGLQSLSLNQEEQNDA